LSESDSAKQRRPGGGWKAIVIWLAVSLAMGVLCWYLDGPDAVEASLDNYVSQILNLIPRMSAAVLIGGFIQVLVPRSLVARWLGDGAGFRGILIATGVGALTPGGPMLAFPLVLVLRNSGASLTSVITFITAWAVLGIHRIVMWELPFMGTEFAAVRYISSIPLPIIAGLTIMLITHFIGDRKPDDTPGSPPETPRGAA
tara:strand:- start:81 stop:680 length:600 start_codon:yes stop_codon:yes gene_type:complete